MSPGLNILSWNSPTVQASCASLKPVALNLSPSSTNWTTSTGCSSSIAFPVLKPIFTAGNLNNPGLKHENIRRSQERSRQKNRSPQRHRGLWINQKLPAFLCALCDSRERSERVVNKL